MVKTLLSRDAASGLGFQGLEFRLCPGGVGGDGGGLIPRT